MTLSGSGMVAGVAGRPIAHSLSPLIHNAWLRATGLDGVYVPLEVETDGFERLVDGLRASSFRGLNVTAPFKERALTLADTVDQAAREAGAANLLVFRSSGDVEGRNTDGLGLLRALAEQAPGLQLHGVTAAILGAGGAARGAGATLLAAGASEVRLINRTPDKADVLAEQLGPRASPRSWAQMADALDGADLLINATTLGRDGGEPLAAPLERLREGATVMDMVYRPLRTPLLAQAEARGLTTVDGLAMLIGQAAPSFEGLFGRPPPELDVRALALEALR